MDNLWDGVIFVLDADSNEHCYLVRDDSGNILFGIDKADCSVDAMKILTASHNDSVRLSQVVKPLIEDGEAVIEITDELTDILDNIGKVTELFSEKVSVGEDGGN